MISILSSLPPTFNYDSESINTVSTYLGAPEEPGSVEDTTSTTEEATNKEQSNDKESEAPVEIKVTSPKSSETVVENPDEASKPEETDGNKLSDSGLKPLSPSPAPSSDTEQNEFVNSQGITFTPTAESIDDSGRLIPYGLPCVRELFRFLVSLINPHDSHNLVSCLIFLKFYFLWFLPYMIIGLRCNQSKSYDMIQITITL